MRTSQAVSKWKSDPQLRTKGLLYAGLAIDLVYALIQAANGIVFRAIWPGTLAFYHLVLGGIRFSLLLGHKNTSERQKWQKYTACGLIMLLLIVALLAIHCITLYMGHTIIYPGYMIYAIAAYTFYAAITAIRNILRKGGHDDPILFAGRALALAVAAISLYTLQSAMISAFGDSEPFKATMSRCLGAAVFALILALSIFMLIKGVRALRR